MRPSTAAHLHPADGDAVAPAVLQVLPSLDAGGGGVERGTIEIAQALIDAGCRAIVASAGGQMTRELSRIGATHLTLPLASKNPFVMRRNAERLTAAINDHGVHLVHARSRAPAWSAWRAAQAANCAFVTTFHGTYNRGPFAIKKPYNAIMTKGEPVIAISEFIRDHMIVHYGIAAERIRVVHRGVDLSVFDPARVSQERIIRLARRWRLPEDCPTVMLPGRLTRWKGQLLLIDALARLNRPEVRCLLVGADQGRSRYRAEIERRAQAAGLTANVHIVDDCDDMAAAYMLTDVVISASTDPEAFGRVVAEGQAMGRPVIAPDHGAAREILLPDVTGRMFMPKNADALAKALGWALDLDETARSALAERAIAHSRTHFSTAQMCEKTLAVYEEALARYHDFAEDG